MMTISEYVNLSKCSVSKEDDTVAETVVETPAEPVADAVVNDTTTTVTDTETTATTTTPVEEVEVTTQVEFDTVNDDNDTVVEAAEVSSDEVMEASDELNDTIVESNEVIEQQETTAEVYDELSEEVPVLESKLESPETITPAETMVVTESLKYKLKRLNIPLNNSRALVNIGREEFINTPAQAYAIAIEDEKTLLQKTGDALKKAWEWIKKQFGKFAELVKRVFGNVKAQGEKMISDLKNSQTKEAVISKEDMSKIAGIAPTATISRAKRSELNKISRVAETISIEIKEFIEAKDKETVKQNIVKTVSKLNDAFSGAFNEYLDKVENKDYGVKGIIGLGDKYISVLLLNLEGDDIEVKHEKVPVEAPEVNEEKVTADTVITGIKAAIDIAENAIRYQNVASDYLKNSPVEIEGSRIKTILTNRWINRLALTGYQDLHKYANGNVKYYMALGRRILGQSLETKEENKTA